MLNLYRKKDIVLVQDMDDELLAVCPDPEYILDMEGWEFGESSMRVATPDIMRNGSGWFDRRCYPPEFVDYVDRADCCAITAFSDQGMFEEPTGLDWHVDFYWVYAWNLEGNTTWHYFDLIDGTVKKHVLGAMDKVILMPPGTPHRVTVESSSRISLSITRPSKWDLLFADGPIPEDYKGT